MAVKNHLSVTIIIRPSSLFFMIPKAYAILAERGGRFINFMESQYRKWKVWKVFVFTDQMIIFFLL